MTYEERIETLLNTTPNLKQKVEKVIYWRQEMSNAEMDTDTYIIVLDTLKRAIENTGLTEYELQEAIQQI